jgi:hypothetical protein
MRGMADTAEAPSMPASPAAAPVRTCFADRALAWRAPWNIRRLIQNRKLATVSTPRLTGSQLAMTGCQKSLSTNSRQPANWRSTEGDRRSPMIW